MLREVQAQSVGMSGERLLRLTAWLERQVGDGRLAGCSAMVGRRGEIPYFAATGQRDKELDKPFERDSIVRIYSMTKPVTTVAAMSLYEAGCFQLDDPVARYLPEFADTPVWTGGDIGNTVAQETPMLVRHLMTHTSGLTYGFMQTNPVDALYRENTIEFPGGGGSLADLVARVAGIPLICQPGTQWNYSVSTDVLGRLVEVWSGKSLSDYMAQALFTPLRMTDTGFHVEANNHHRFSALYAPETGGGMSDVGKKSTATGQAARGGLKLQESSERSRFLQPTELYSGGGGLTSTIDDYARFLQMLLNRGELDGVRVLSRKTVEHMRLNHLPNNSDMAAMGQPVWSETSYDGIGFGLGFAVVLDPAKASIITSPGEHHWGGAASTFFWIDPAEDLFVIFLTQLMPSSTYPIRRELRARVYQTLID